MDEPGHGIAHHNRVARAIRAMPACDLSRKSQPLGQSVQRGIVKLMCTDSRPALPQGLAAVQS